MSSTIRLLIPQLAILLGLELNPLRFFFLMTFAGVQRSCLGTICFYFWRGTLKCHYAKDIVFETDTSIFCTGKHELVFIKGGCIDERETKMMRVRWKIFNFSSQIPHCEQRNVPPCPRCFAKLILSSNDNSSA